MKKLSSAIYCARSSRPSIDPIVFFKLQLIAFFEGIRSERKLMETVNVNLAHRWYIGYDLTEAVPDHSSLSKIRERYGLTTFSSSLSGLSNCAAKPGWAGVRNSTSTAPKFKPMRTSAG